MPQNSEFVSAIAVRMGMAAGAVLGGFLGYWASALRTPEAGDVVTSAVLATVAGAAASFVAAWAALAWLARTHRGAGVIAGGLLTAAAAAALLAWFAWPRAG